MADETSRRPRGRWWIPLLDPTSDPQLPSTSLHEDPAWRRRTEIESLLPAAISIVVAIVLQVTLAGRVANHPRWILPGIAAALLVGIVVADRATSNKHSPLLRGAILLLIAVLSAANIASAVRLVIDLVNSQGIRDPGQLLIAGGAIWMTNVIVFGLWYWEFDRGGRAARAANARPYPSFLFPQMSDPTFAPPDWEPTFLDYLYTSLTCATAFSPTDAMPLSRWAKAAMGLQATISLVIAVLVVARAVNILR
jgi:uncharacterized membrane protein